VLQGGSVEHDARCSAGRRQHFDVGPGDAGGDAGSQALGDGLLGGEPSCVAFESSLGAEAFAIGALGFRADAQEQALRHVADALDLDDVDSDSDHHRCAQRCILGATVDLEQLEFLQGEGSRHLAAFASVTDPFELAQRLRKALDPEHARSVQEQLVLREKARAKFGDLAEKMFFTRRLLEQASGLAPARWKAKRFVEAGVREITDLCCGSGGDALAFGFAGISCHRVDADPVALALSRHNLSAAGIAPGGETETFLPELPDDAVRTHYHLDPDRRSRGHEDGEDRWDHDGLSPDRTGIVALAKRFQGGAIKLSPGAPEGFLDFPGETEFIGVRDELREQVLWTGDLAQGRLRATEIGTQDRVETFEGAPQDAQDAFSDLAEDVGAWIHEPVKALVRSHLSALYGQSRGLGLMDATIAWLTGAQVESTPLLKSYRVLTHGVLKVGTEAALLKEAGRSCGAVKKRGVAVVPEKAMRELRGLPGEPAVLVYTRVAGRKWVLVVEPG